MSEPRTAQDELFVQIRGYYVTRALLTLWRIGALDRALDDGHLDVGEFASERGHDVELLSALLNYLTTRGYFVAEQGGRFGLSQRGEASRAYFGYLPMLVGSYQPMFDGLEDVLTGALSYGDGVVRDGRERALGVRALEQNLLDSLLEVLDTLHFTKVVDLGSGSATLLCRICEPVAERRGIGIDIDATACREAESYVRKLGLDDRVSIVLGDMADAADLPVLGAGDVDLVVAMFVMHELLKQRGRAGVVACLSGIASALSDGGRLAMVEVSKPARYEATEQVFIPEYELVHDFSNQQLASKDEWHAMVAEAGLVVETVAPIGMCRAFCFVASAARMSDREPAREPETSAASGAG